MNVLVVFIDSIVEFVVRRIVEISQSSMFAESIVDFIRCKFNDDTSS